VFVKEIQQGIFGIYLSIGLKLDADTAAALAGIPVVLSVNAPNGVKFERSSAVVADDVVLDLAQARVRFKPRSTDLQAPGEYHYQIFFEGSGVRLPSNRGRFWVLENNSRV
jgi:hypothetical protein